MKWLAGCVTLLCVLLINPDSKACSCALTMQTDLSEILPRYTFVAHVKIIGKHALTKADSAMQGYGTTMQLNFEVKELFKGTANTTVYELSINTSCDMGIENGSEWLLFGEPNANGSVFVHYCGGSKRLSPKYSFENSGFNNAADQLKQLYIFYHKPIPGKKNGKEISYYDNGVKKSEASYLNGLLEGEELLYNRIGKLFQRNFYRNGVKQGIFTTYHWLSGELEMEERFANNIRISKKIWYDTSQQTRSSSVKYEIETLKLNKSMYDSLMSSSSDSVPRLFLQYNYDSTAHHSIEKKYWWDGKIRETTIISAAEKVKTVYYHDGKTWREITTNPNDMPMHERVFDRDGQILSSRSRINGRWVDDGKN